MHKIETVGELLKSVARFSNSKALNCYCHESWKILTTQEYLLEVKFLALALIQLGVQKEDKVGIMAPSSSRWTLADLAIMAIGAVSVPLFSNISEENFIYEISHAEVKYIFVEGQESWERYEKDRALFKKGMSLEYNGFKKEGVVSYEQLLALGKQLESEQPDLYLQKLESLQPGDLATIIYTSGTTGLPQGVEHTHKSLTSPLSTDLFDLDWKSDSYLNVLPLAHVFARVLNLIMLCWGVSIYYFNDLKNLKFVCSQVHPTLMVVVPRLLEKVYTKMVTSLQEQSPMKRTIGQWAFDLANQEEESTWKNIFHPIAETLVYSHLREALGENLRVVISGGAALDPHLYHFLLDIGIPVYEGWGLTEACPVTVNRKEKIKVGTIGRPIQDLKVKVDAEGEILVSGNNVMRGYHKNLEATHKAIDSEGWLHTGDLGSIDEEGFVTLIGRKKEMLKTSTGEYIVPAPIERALCKAPFIEMAMVLGDKRKFASCLLVPNFDILHSLKASQNLSNISDDEFLKSDYIKDEMNKLLQNINSHLNHWEEIREYRFIPRPLTIDEGELTPSMKFVKRVVEAKFKDLIDSIYSRV